MSFRVEIDPRRCAGTSNCVEEAPEAFEVSEDGLARLKATTASSEALLRGAEACPGGAISLFDLATGRRVFP